MLIKVWIMIGYIMQGWSIPAPVQFGPFESRERCIDAQKAAVIDNEWSVTTRLTCVESVIGVSPK